VSAASRLQNEQLYRAANQAIDHNRHPADGRLLAFLCECSDTDCRTDIQLTQEEYDVIRRGRLRFAVAPGHEDGVERVLDEFDRYTIVQK
jgi:hypothetical protein